MSAESGTPLSRHKNSHLERFGNRRHLRKLADGSLVGPGLDVTATASPGDGSLGAMRDRGDGTYEVDYQAAGFAGATDFIEVQVNQIFLESQLEITAQ